MVQLFSAKSSKDIEVENLGVARLKAFVEKNNESVEITYLNINGNYKEQMKEVILDNTLFGFSMYNDTIDFFTQVINEIKYLRPDATIFVGSKFATLYYREILESIENVDLVILGDGEKTLLDLINCIKSNNDIKQLVTSHKNIASKNNMENKIVASLDINELPWPDRSWMKNKRVYFALICDAHGCMGKCSFCTWNNYCTKWSGRSAEDIYNEITEINDKYKVRFFYFTSGSFEDPGNLGKEKIRKLCLLLKKYNKKFTFRYFFRADSFSRTEEDRELLKLMRSCGFKLVTVGVESGNDDDLEVYNKRATVQQNKATLELIEEMDIYAKSIGFIMFNPYTTHKKLTLNYRFLSEFRSGSIEKYITKLRVYRYTKLFERIKKEGLLTDEGSYYQVEGCSYKFKEPDIEEIDQFIQTYLHTSEIISLNRQLEISYDTILSFYDFIENGEVYKNKLIKIYDKNAELLITYFYHLYEEFDIKKCKELLPEMLKIYSDNIKELQMLRFSLCKKINKMLDLEKCQ
jgi:radical SAM superfamily enzyme YgiQ (UPF0313 family)